MKIARVTDTAGDVQGGLTRSRHGLQCECLLAITLYDLERGYHPCGRSITVVLGEPHDCYAKRD